MAETAVEPKMESSTYSSSGTHYNLPSSQILSEAGELLIQDESGNSVPFKSLYQDKPNRQLIVFIRHFFCGHCESYTRYLSTHLPPSLLETTTPPTTLTIIGCGDPVCIPDYKTRTSAPYTFYTDPSRALYAKLDMIQNLGPGGPAAPEYLKTSVLGSTLSSAKNILTSGAKGFKGGNYSQNGGEWLFEGGEVKWVRRMRGSADHTLISELEEVLGVKGETKT